MRAEYEVLVRRSAVGGHKMLTASFEAMGGADDALSLFVLVAVMAKGFTPFAVRRKGAFYWHTREQVRRAVDMSGGPVVLDVESLRIE